MRFRITYVDGETVEGEAEQWSAVRSDGVDTVTFDNILFQGHSVYWLRSAEGGWVAGAASFYPNPITEVVCREGQPQEGRKLEKVPDLYHFEVKLGWWWTDG